MVDNVHGFDADSADAQQQVDDVFFVVGEAVGVEFFADGGVAGFALFVAVEHPFEGGAVAEFVFPGDGGDAAEGGIGVELNGAVGFVGFEFGFVGGADQFGVDVVASERGWVDGFVGEVQVHELLAPLGPLPEVVVEGDAREFAFEVEFVFFAVGGVVQDGVDVVEDVAFCNGGLVSDDTKVSETFVRCTGVQRRTARGTGAAPNR